LKGPLEDKVVNNQGEFDSLIFAKFDVDGITDLQVGPDGYLYVLAGKDDRTLIYRILPLTDYLKTTSKERIGSEGDMFSKRFTANDERANQYLPSIDSWINEALDIQSISMQEITAEDDLLPEPNRTFTVKIEEGNSSSWAVVSTDYIPIDGYTPYKYSLNISAKDVNQLHSKIYYYDSNKNEIKTDFVFHGTDGTFKDTITNTLITPSNASYVKLQIWVLQNPEKNSYYLLHNAVGFQLINECHLDVLYQDPRC
jgi:hypothetical protein